jgi:lysozyme
MGLAILNKSLTTRFRHAALAVIVAFAAGCAVEDHSWRYGQKSDAKPHPGVASAQRYPVHGIDISRWQGTIDWRAVRGAGTRFAFIKATEGGDHIDPRFRENWAGARAAGIPTGAYHFVYWCRPAHEQAQWFVQHIPQANDNLALPPILDVEWNGHSRTCPRKVSRETAIEKMRVMLRELEQHTGKRPIIYTDIPFHKDVIEGTTEFEGYPFWIRSTAARPEERYTNRRWEFWQYTTAMPSTAPSRNSRPGWRDSTTSRCASPQAASRARHSPCRNQRPSWHPHLRHPLPRRSRSRWMSRHRPRSKSPPNSLPG